MNRPPLRCYARALGIVAFLAQSLALAQEFSAPDGAQLAPIGQSETSPRPEVPGSALADADVSPVAPRMPSSEDRLEFLAGEDREYAVGRNYKAWLDRSGFTYVPYFGSDAERAWPIFMQVASAAVGSTVLDVEGKPAPHRVGKRMTLSQGDVTSRYDFALEAVEQSFLIRTGAHQGELVLELKLDTDLALEPLDEGARFACKEGHVHHGAAFALDDAGHQIAIATEYVPGAMRFTVPAWFVAAAKGQVVVDPVLSTFDVDGFAGKIQRNPDVAYDLDSDSFTYVYEELFAGNDADLFRTTVSTAGNVISFGFVSAASADERRPSIANLLRLEQHLIVAEQVQPDGFTEIIAFTYLPASNSQSFQFTIADTGSGTTRWTNRRPDVGGSAATFTNTRCCVVWEREFASGLKAARARTVEDSTSLDSVFALSVLAVDATAVSISKSTGDPSTFNRWNTAWLESPGSGTNRIRGVQINGQGSFVQPASTLHTFGPGESLQVLDVSDGLRVFEFSDSAYFIVFDESVVNSSDMTAVLCQRDMARGVFDLEYLEHAPFSVDEDVIRLATTRDDFVVSYLARSSGSSDYTVTITCLDIDPLGEIAVSERRTQVGTSAGRGSNEEGDFVCMASRFSGGNFGSRYIGLGWPHDIDDNGDLDIAGAVHFASNPEAAGIQYCEGTTNSTGDRGFVALYGNRSTSGAKAIEASALPPGQFGLLIVGRLMDSTPGAGGSSGTLCLGGALGRYNASISAANAAGRISFPVDPTAIPQGSGLVAALAGQRFNWQVWHRDINGAGVTSNFTNAVSLRFN